MPPPEAFLQCQLVTHGATRGSLTKGSCRPSFCCPNTALMQTHAPMRELNHLADIRVYSVDVRLVNAWEKLGEDSGKQVMDLASKCRYWILFHFYRFCLLPLLTEESTLLVLASYECGFPTTLALGENEHSLSRVKRNGCRPKHNVLGFVRRELLL